MALQPDPEPADGSEESDADGLDEEDIMYYVHTGIFFGGLLKGAFPIKMEKHASPKIQ